MTISELVRQALARHDANVEFDHLLEIAEEPGSAAERMNARLDASLENSPRASRPGAAPTNRIFR